MKYIESCDALSKALLAQVRDVSALRQQLINIDVRGWMRVNIKEVTMVILSPPAQPTDLQLYAAAYLCNLARPLLELFHDAHLPLSGADRDVVCSMGLKALRMGSLPPPELVG